MISLAPDCLESIYYTFEMLPMAIFIEFGLSFFVCYHLLFNIFKIPDTLSKQAVFLHYCQPGLGGEELLSELMQLEFILCGLHCL